MKVPWFEPPRLADELLAQRARLLHRLLSAIVLIVVLLLLVGLLIAPRPLFALAVYGTFAALHLGLLALLSRGHVGLVGSSYVAVYCALIAALVWWNGGVHPNHSMSFVIITMLAGLTVSPRAGGVVAAGSSLFTVAVALAEGAGRLPPPIQPTTLVEDVTSNVASFVFAAVFVAIAMRGLREAVSQARAAEERTQARARLDAALAALAPRALSEPTAEAFAQAVVRCVRETLEARAAGAVERQDGRARVLAAAGVEGLDANTPEPCPPTPRWADAVAPWTGRVAQVAIAGRGGPRGQLAVLLREGHAEDEATLEFLATAAAMLGARVAHEEDASLLRQAQKMEVVGRLAGGVAHDFNNLLTTMLGCTSLLGDAVKGEHRELVRDIQEAAERASLMTRQLLAFSRKQVLRPAPIDVNVAISDFQHVLRRLMRSDVTVELRLDEGPAQVLADRSSLEQVLLNLCVNARDAMPKGGRLRLATRVEPGWVRLEVSDTGHGMDEATRRRLFEPFFTTKPDGTGLGLPTVKSLLDRAGGAIDVTSEPGAGTTFTLSLPRAGLEAVPPPPAPAQARGSGRLLLVDDDAQVRATTRRLLESAGYVVHDVGSGADALAALAREPGFDLVITDVVMPGMSGPEFAARARAAGAAVPTLFISGYVADELPQGAFLAKPYQAQDLLAAVQSALARPLLPA